VYDRRRTYSNTPSISQFTTKRGVRFVTWDHIIRFQEMYPKTGFQAIIQVACTNGLSTVHKAENCGSPATCRVCQQRHQSLLHQGRTSNPLSGAATIAGYDNLRGYVLLATAKVSLQGPIGQLQTCRALLHRCILSQGG